MSYELRRDRNSVNSPSEKYARVPAEADIPSGPCRYLLVGTAGTATLTRRDGTVVEDVPLVKGYNPLVCIRVALGTAEDVFYCL